MRIGTSPPPSRTRPRARAEGGFGLWRFEYIYIFGSGPGGPGAARDETYVTGVAGIGGAVAVEKCCARQQRAAAAPRRLGRGLAPLRCRQPSSTGSKNPIHYVQLARVALLALSEAIRPAQAVTFHTRGSPGVSCPPRLLSGPGAHSEAISNCSVPRYSAQRALRDPDREDVPPPRCGPRLSASQGPPHKDLDSGCRSPVDGLRSARPVLPAAAPEARAQRGATAAIARTWRASSAPRAASGAARAPMVRRPRRRALHRRKRRSRNEGAPPARAAPGRAAIPCVPMQPPATPRCNAFFGSRTLATCNSRPTATWTRPYNC